MGIFSPDSKFSVVTNMMLDYVKLGLLFMLFSIPVFTAGAAASAAMYVAMKIERGEAPAVWVPYLQAFKKNFRQSLGLTLIVLVVTALLAFDWYQVMQMDGTIPVRVARAGVFILALIFVMAALYLFPNLARYELSSRQIIRNSLVFAISNFTKNLVALIIIGSGIAFYYLVPAMIPVVVCAFPALLIFYMARVCVRTFDRLEGKNEEEDTDKDTDEDTDDTRQMNE